MKKPYRVCFVFLFAMLLSGLLFPVTYCMQSVSTESPQVRFGELEQTYENVNVDYWVFLSGSYRFLDLDVRHEVTINITLPQPPPAIPFDITFNSIPFSLRFPLDLPPSVSFEYGFFGSPPTAVLTIHFPANTSYSSIKLEGRLYGQSFLWRNSATIEPLGFSSSIPNTCRLLLVPPSQSKVLRVYSRAYPDLSYVKENAEGHESVVVAGQDFMRLGGVGLAVLFESETWEIYAFLVMLIMILVLFIFPYTLRARATSNLIVRFRQRLPQKPITILKWLSQIPLAIFRQLQNKLSKLNSSKLLAAFIICGLLMTSLSFVAGPDPRTKVYVFASQEETANEIKDFIAARGGVTVSSLEEIGDLEALANLGIFSAAIVGDFYSPSRSLAEGKIYPSLNNIVNDERQYSIILLKIENTTWYAPDEFSSEIERRYPDKTTIVADLNSFDAALRQIKGRENALGLDISPATYLGVCAFVGLFSFILVFFGLAFLACKLTEAGKKLGVRGFPEAIAYTVFYFFFTQIIYIACSVLLTMPLGLHTTRLEAKVTAVSLLGFGGGSNPRMFAGIAGFLFGAFVSLKEGVKLDKVGFSSLLVMAFFVIVDPLTSGLFFHELVLLNTVGPSFGTAVQTESYIRDFLAYIGVALGGWASPTYGISTGIILYFAGAIPFCLFPKLQRSTATVFLFISAACIGTGGIRVADMNPWKTVASVFPGVAAGFVIAVVFSLISVAEIALRKKLVSGSP